MGTRLKSVIGLDELEGEHREELMAKLNGGSSEAQLRLGPAAIASRKAAHKSPVPQQQDVAVALPIATVGTAPETDASKPSQGNGATATVGTDPETDASKPSQGNEAS